MSNIVHKPWGHEVIWSVTERYAAKLLHIDAGQRLSLQSHAQKDESILVLHGVLVLHLEQDGELNKRVMKPGDCAHITPGLVHRFEGETDCTLVEVSTPELDDVIRYEDDYGRVAEEAA